MEYPTANWPDIENVIYQFVQLEIDRKPYLRFGLSYHSDVLEAALHEFGITGYEEMPITRLGNLCIIPKPESVRYKAVGMGRMTKSKDKMRFFGDSYDYKIEPDKNHLQSIMNMEPERRFEIVE